MDISEYRTHGYLGMLAYSHHPILISNFTLPGHSAHTWRLLITSPLTCKVPQLGNWACGVIMLPCRFFRSLSEPDV